MDERYLYTTAVPVLLGGGRLAGKTALYLYTRYGLEVRWLGEGWHPLLAIYAKRLASLPLTVERDVTLTRHLLAFAKSCRKSISPARGRYWRRNLSCSLCPISHKAPSADFCGGRSRKS